MIKRSAPFINHTHTLSRLKHQRPYTMLAVIRNNLKEV